MVSRGIQDARHLVLFGTHHLDVPASQSGCSLRDPNPVLSASTVTVYGITYYLIIEWICKKR
ncbi:unnamed protein product [Schistosoma mattheei]|uniref:Uncharacterized protein n=1 Tax=Schistosoma mattheei TaxID=31246 RepID=A0A183PC91_9TREM|nr:unnamed protein product [Schistosoma mattheei]